MHSARPAPDCTQATPKTVKFVRPRRPHRQHSRRGLPSCSMSRTSHSWRRWSWFLLLWIGLTSVGNDQCRLMQSVVDTTRRPSRLSISATAAGHSSPSSATQYGTVTKASLMPKSRPASWKVYVITMPPHVPSHEHSTGHTVTAASPGRWPVGLGTRGPSRPSLAGCGGRIAQGVAAATGARRVGKTRPASRSADRVAIESMFRPWLVGAGLRSRTGCRAATPCGRQGRVRYCSGSGRRQDQACTTSTSCRPRIPRPWQPCGPNRRVGSEPTDKGGPVRRLAPGVRQSLVVTWCRRTVVVGPCRP